MSESIAELGQKLWGPPNKTHSTRDELRFGTHGSKSVKLKERTWFDHEANEGGGYVDLYEKVHGERPSIAENVVTTYDYKDLQNNLLYQVVRMVPKAFRQRRPDGNGGWLWNMHGIERIPYKLPELLKSTGTVFIVEGERDADALHERGLIATTNPGGAGKWLPTMSQYLCGRDVIILPDNDDAGENHVRDVVSKLSGIARSVGIIRLPDLPAKGDVSDWLAVGHTAEELEQLVAAEPETARAEGKTEDSASHALRDLLAIEAWAQRETPPPDRLLGDLVTTTTRMFLVGRTGLGKTLLALALGCGMASGQGFLHWRSARAARVLILDGEMPGELIRQRAIDALRRAGIVPKPGHLMIYARDAEDDLANHLPTVGRMPPLNTQHGLSWVLALIDTLGGVDVVIFDNVMSLIAGDQKDELAWSDTLELVQTLTARRIGQIWLDHTGHNTDRQYGSSTKAWRFDAVGIMAPLSDEMRNPQEVAFTLSFENHGKARRRTPENWEDFETRTIRLREDQWTADANGQPAAAKPSEGRLKDKPAAMLAEARRLISSQGHLVHPSDGSKLVKAISRQLLRKGLIACGWFPDNMLRIASQCDPELARNGFAPENHALTTLQRNRLLAFTREWVWLP